MKTFKFISLILVVLFLLASLASGRARSGQEIDASTQLASNIENFQYPTDQLIIQYRTTDNTQLASPTRTDEIERLSLAAGIELAYLRPMSGDAYVLKLPSALPESDVAAIAARLMTLPDVAYAEPDAIVFPMQSGDQPDEIAAWPVNDPNYSAQWHFFEPGDNHYGINAPAGWEINKGAANIVVAVIDTGITSHPDLTGRIAPGHDFIADIPTANDGNGRDADPSDPGDWITVAESSAPGGPFAGCVVKDSSWHGTHVAGTIGAATNNGIGVAGVNWNSKVLPVRALGKCGGYSSDITDGIRWAAGLPVIDVPNNANPAKVINLSLGSKGVCLNSYQQAFDAVTAIGATVVVSAGNDNANAIDYRPGNCQGVITVAATNRNGARAFYSNYGPTVEISAPGGEITSGNTSNGVLSTLNQGTQGPTSPWYEYYQGTSMAAPHVAGVVSLLYSNNPNITPAVVLRLLQDTATQFPAGSTCSTSICGTGIVNAGDALRQPLITALSYGQLGGAITQTQLTVSGVNFAISSTVYLSGSPLPTTFLNSQNLHATLTVTDVMTSTTRQVIVETVYPFGVYTSTPMGLYRVFLPLLTVNYGWNTVFSDNFDNGLSSSWVVTDTNASGYTWAGSACKPFQGSASAWMMAGGSKGPAACGSNYANKMKSWMIYGPFNLTNALAAEARLQLWLNTESFFDKTCLMASKDGVNFRGDCYYGSVLAWNEKNLDLANVPNLAGLLGESNVWVAIYFETDSSNVKPEGAYIDNFILRKCLGGNCTPAPAVVNPVGLYEYPWEVQLLP